MKNHSITPDIRPTIIDFNRFVTLPDIAEQMSEAAQKLLPQISDQKPYAVTDLRFTDLKEKPPEQIGSIRIAVFYPGMETKIERHPNSTQFLYSIQGTGETRVLRNEKWEKDCYGKISNDAIPEERWHVVNRGIWHQSVATGDQPWVLAALHTATQVEDEYK